MNTAMAAKSEVVAVGDASESSSEVGKGIKLRGKQAMTEPVQEPIVQRSTRKRVADDPAPESQGPSKKVK